jgi:low temperature requirement protein LtrA
MNSAFIIIGLIFIFSNFYKFKDFMIKNKIVFYILTLVAAIGVIIVALIHAGNPVTDGYHSLGAIMAILGGNILLLVVSRSMDKFEIYQKVSLILGVIGLIAFWVMFFNMGSLYMPIFERLSVYTLIIWSFITGVYLLKEF